MTKDMFKQQLRALQANLAATIQTTQTLLDMLQEEENEQSSTGPLKCKHPEDTLQDASTMGHPGRFRCQLCGDVITVVHAMQ